MPTSNSAAKRMRTSEEKRIKNRSVKSTIASARNSLYEAIAAGDKARSQTLLREYFSQLDKAAKKNIIKGNTADRKKSRASLRMKSL